MADDPSHGDKDRNAPTVRELNGPTSSGDTLPDLIGMYVPPRPLPEAAQHRTMDLKSVRLSDQADPRRALTERRLVSPPQPARSRSGWWMAAGVAVLLGALAWLLLAEPTPSASLAPPREPAPPLPTRASAGAPKALAPAPSTSPAPREAAPKASGPSVDAPAAPAPKTSRPRESSKKRKDPWLE
jgi:hypothetical protein